jgi:signal transduction histidine kinase
LADDLSGRRHHRHSVLRRRLFAQIYVVVVGSVLLLSFLVGLSSHFFGDRAHSPLLPVLAALIVSVAAWPVSRRLTRRLERLKSAVEALGEGDLAARADVRGNDEVATLAASFNRSAERIAALLAGHRRLLANASHELRSPLTRLRMGLELLAEKVTIPDAQKQGLYRDIRELDQLVEEILLASRLDTPELPLERQPVDLAGLLAEECARLDAECIAVPLEAAGDPRLLRRLMRNLLENARRHGGGEVDAELIDAGEEIVLDIRDRGPGIPAGEAARLFEPFYRPAGAGEGRGGWGLGLSLVRQIAERHGGTVACLTRAGGGSIFRVRLPKASIQSG